jgi:hypothetical protein
MRLKISISIAPILIAGAVVAAAVYVANEVWRTMSGPHG